MPRMFHAILALWGFALLPGTALAEDGGDPIAQCATATIEVASQSGVPLAVLHSAAEIGAPSADQLRPWPWTVNISGRAVWFDTAVQAKSSVFQVFTRGGRSFDIGCFQLNYAHFAGEFATIDAMFDPIENARVAATALKNLYAELGDWDQVLGTFHRQSHRVATQTQPLPEPPETANMRTARAATLRSAPRSTADVGNPDKPLAGVSLAPLLMRQGG